LSNQVHPACLIWTELDRAGARIDYSEPSWNLLFRNWIMACKLHQPELASLSAAPSAIGRVDCFLTDPTSRTQTKAEFSAAFLELLDARSDLRLDAPTQATPGEAEPCEHPSDGSKP
jgi:hypothetical protein